MKSNITKMHGQQHIKNIIKCLARFSKNTMWNYWSW